jgi:xylonate dehydratase
MQHIVDELPPIGQLVAIAVDVAYARAIREEHVVSRCAPSQIDVLANLDVALSAEDGETGVAPRRETGWREPVDAEVSRSAVALHHRVAEIFELSVFGVLEVADLRGNDFRAGRLREEQELVELVRSDVAEDPAVPRRIPEPRRALRRMNAMRPESNRLHDVTDRAGLHELTRLHRRRVLEPFAVADRIDPLRRCLHATHFGELRPRREPRLVGHVVLVVLHHPNAERRSLVGHDGRQHELDRRILEDRVLIARLFGARVASRERRSELGFPGVEGHELAAAAQHGVHLAVNVTVVHADHAEAEARCWHQRLVGALVDACGDPIISRMRQRQNIPPIDAVLGSADVVAAGRIAGHGPEGSLHLTAEQLRDEPSGNLFGLTQNAGMGWSPAAMTGPQFVIVSTMGGMRADDGRPIALGYHTGHWEIGLLVREAAETLRAAGAIPFAAYCSDPCDGRTQGTTGMFDSLPYRNDAATVMRRQIRSLPTASGVMAVATCDKGLPATMLALAGSRSLPGIVVPGGVTLPAAGAEDAGQVQSLGARFARDLVTLDYAAEMGCRACGSSGGGCQFLGTAATSQVVAEALGLALPHSALSPSGEPVWLELGRRSATALLRLDSLGIPMARILTDRAIENAMLVHAAFGGSTNLLLHIPAIAHAAGLRVPTVDDWIRVNRATPRLVDVLPNGPRGHPTVQVFMAGGVPEVMGHLRRLDLLHLDVMTATGDTLGTTLDWWEGSERRRAARARLASAAAISPDDVIMSPDAAKRAGLTSTVVFPRGNLAPDGAVIKATAIHPSVVGDHNVFRHRGPARVFPDERAAIRAVKGQDTPIQAGDVIVLIGAGPLGTGMEETAQITTALKYLPWGKHVALLTDGRFSGLSTGACVGHIGPEALAGGPIARVRDGDLIEIVIDRASLIGSIDLVGIDGEPRSPAECAAALAERAPHPDLAPNEALPPDTRLWAALQRASGGTWGGCVYDVDRIVHVLNAGEQALAGSFERIL